MNENYSIHSLEIVDTIEQEDLSYEFNMLRVWKDKNNILYWAKDSGCSCPAPFENFHTVADLNKLTLSSLNAFEAEVKSFPATMQDKNSIIQKVIEIVKNKK